jgi:GDPmannose 4,6-dehydratase
MNKIAIVTGCQGQDGSYLCEFLLEKKYKVFGVSRRCSSRENDFIKNFADHENFTLINLDITDASGINNLISSVRPDEYYNLAASSHVGQSFKEPTVSLKNNGEAVAIALEAIVNSSPLTKFYQASTSELFGNSPGPQSESTNFDPRSPYAAAKLYAHKMVGLYREAYGIHASCGILFNHESPRRGLDFVTRKITRGISNFIKNGQKFTLGNLEAKRDWGHAKDYVKAMWIMLQQDHPDDYVIGTGETASIKEALDFVISVSGISETPYVIDDKMKRPAEVNLLCANPEKANKKLGWKASLNWKDVLYEMYLSDTKDI